MKFRPSAGSGLLLALAAAAACSGLELAAPFTDHAVLQQDVAVPVWGWDDQPGAEVTVAFAGQLHRTRVSVAGSWRVDLAPLVASAEGRDLVVTRGHTSVTLRGVVVGEVWLASGQSNLEWTLARSPVFHAAEKVRPANPLIRHLRVEQAGADVPAARVPRGAWQTATPETLGGFSAVGYYFARDLAEALGVPVGIINSSYGGTAIESWLPEPVLRAQRRWLEIERTQREAMQGWPESYAAHPARHAAWEADQASSRAAGTPPAIPWPRPPQGPGSAFSPARLYNGMIFPLAPYALRGALWYQGESNAVRHHDYAELLPALIGAWRATWPLGDFPFLVVQLPNYSVNGQPAGRTWAHLREAQATAARLPGVGIAVTIDGTEPDELHPLDKVRVGHRLARLALHRVHGRSEVACAGPEFVAMAREGARLRVGFREATGLRSVASAVTGFEIAGEDRVFHAAVAQIEGETVLVSAVAVPEPVAVRYAFVNAPAVSLVNAAGLPAMPFRTDAW